MTCIGNSGDINQDLEKLIIDNNIVVTSVLSGNRNFEGRVHQSVKANYLASPPLVILHALAGKVDIDFDKEPIGYDKLNKPVYKKDIWPSKDEINKIIQQTINKYLFEKSYNNIVEGNQFWQKIQVKGGDLYQWDSKSTYIHKPPYFDDFTINLPKLKSIKNARCLLLLGDSITTDHISPAGKI